MILILCPARVCGKSSLNPLPLALDRLLQSPIPLKFNSCYSLSVLVYLTPKGAPTMEWVTPQHEEIDLNCEVSSYANAEL
jgi:hypothetical protein